MINPPEGIAEPRKSKSWDECGYKSMTRAASRRVFGSWHNTLLVTGLAPEYAGKEIAVIYDISGNAKFAVIPKSIADRLAPEGLTKINKDGKNVTEQFISGAYETLKEAIHQHHERMDGGGYPSGFKGNEINEYSKIIAVVDTYEAMTHHRPYREAMIPHNAIKEIIFSLKRSFDSKAIKALFNRVSIYPVGSFVKLNNGEIAKVISVTTNSFSILRPIVLVILDNQGKCVTDPVKLDLSLTGTVYIKEPFVLPKIKEKDRSGIRRTFW